MLVEHGDPAELAKYLLYLPPNESVLPGLVYIRVGTRLEQENETELAYRVYRRLYELDPASRDAETALFRLGRLLETAYSNPRAALETYSAMMNQFPTGSLAIEGHAAVARMAALTGQISPDRPALAPVRSAQVQPVEQWTPPEPQDVTTRLG